MQHNPIRYGDEYQCAKCGKSWGVDDNDVPECTTPVPIISAEITVQQLLSQVDGLKSMFGEYGGEDDERLSWTAKQWHIYLNIEKLRATIDTHE